MKKVILMCGILFLPFLISAQVSKQTEETVPTILDSIVVRAWRAGKNTPVSHSQLKSSEVRQISPIQSIPMALSLMPSVVSSTEGGNGLGYSSMRVRGSDGTRINVTVNGIALNDAESHEVFWVNIPAFSFFIRDIQLQRGVGTSTNGSGAFGATLNMRTLYTSPGPYGMAESSIGSFNSFSTIIGAGTGLMKSGFSFDARYTKSVGKGYVRNGKSDLTSMFATAALLKGNSSIRLNYIYGDQVTGITWLGVSKDMMKQDRRYNPAGLYYDQAGNKRYYDNETDNYTQQHIQAMVTSRLPLGFTWHNILHFTNGGGYYENYKPNKKFKDYGLSQQYVDGVEYKKSDVIIRQFVTSNYYALSSTLSYNSERLEASSGISYSFYDGFHNGKLIWAMWDESIPKDYTWYENRGRKGDYSLFVKGEYGLTGNLIAFADMQYRGINYKLAGEDKDFIPIDYNSRYHFFNPKGGLTYSRGANRAYLSVAVGRREPARTDIKESIKADRAHLIRPERLIDIECGYSYSTERVFVSGNIYIMEYKDQLVPTGKLSETGYVIKENVPVSYRRGVELAAGYTPWSLLRLESNLSLSMNKIKDYTHWIDMFDNGVDWNPMAQKSLYFESTNLPFSPGIVGMAMATINLRHQTALSLYGKYVGKQFYDNTSSDDRSIPAYFTMGFKGFKNFKIGGNSRLELSLIVENLLNRDYFNNGWVYIANFADGSAPYIEEGLFPQPGINFMFKAGFSF